MEGSHALYHEYYSTHPDDHKRALFRARDEHLQWMSERGCVQKRVPVPAGGMVLWDSRLIHANARPRKGRAQSDRLVSLSCAAYLSRAEQGGVWSLVLPIRVEMS